MCVYVSIAFSDVEEDGVKYTKEGEMINWDGSITACVNDAAIVRNW